MNQITQTPCGKDQIVSRDHSVVWDRSQLAAGFLYLHGENCLDCEFLARELVNWAIKEFGKDHICLTIGQRKQLFYLWNQMGVNGELK